MTRFKLALLSAVLLLLVTLAGTVYGGEQLTLFRTLLQHSGIDRDKLNTAVKTIDQWRQKLNNNGDDVTGTVLQSAIVNKHLQFAKRPGSDLNRLPLQLPVVLRFKNGLPGRMQSAYAGLDDQYRLHIRFKINPVEKLQQHGVYVVWIKPYRGSSTNITVFFNYARGARGPYASLRVGKRRVGRAVKLNFLNRIEPFVYAVIPLGKIFDRFWIPRSDSVLLRAGTMHRHSNNRFAVSRYKTCYYRVRNHAVELLADLLQKARVAPGDTMAAALALANSYLYECGDRLTRKAIKQDIAAHYRLYKRIVRWQKQWRIKYRLDRLPLLAQLSWANRKRRLDHSELLTYRLYREFIDAVDNLAKVHELVRRMQIGDYEFLACLASRLEHHVKSMNIYRSSMESLRKQAARKKKRPWKIYLDARREYQQGHYYTQYCGKKRRWDQFGWLNYQLPKIIRHGKYRGDCGTVTALQMAWYRGAGIAPISFQQKPVPSHIVGHNFPLYYDPFRARWVSVQYPKYENVPMYLYFTLPVVHHLRYNRFYQRKGEMRRVSNYPGELGTTWKVRYALRNGFPDRLVSKLQYGQRTLERGLLFNSQTLPGAGADQDGDGILRSDELRLGLNPRSNDSDRDGYSDSWELEHGYNPKSADSPGDKGLLAVDGLLSRSEMKGALIAGGAEGNKAQRDGADIKLIRVKLLNDRLWLGASFYNDISRNRQHRFTVSMVAFGGKEGHREYWVQWIKGRFYLYRVKRGHKSVYQRLKSWRGGGLPHFSGAAAEHVEITVSKKLFAGAAGVYVKLYSGGWTGKRWRNSLDVSDAVIFLLAQAGRWTTGLQGADGEIADPQGDADGGSSLHDIKQVRWKKAGRWLQVEVTFHHRVDGKRFVPLTVDLYKRRPREKWIYRWFRLDWSKHYRYEGRSLEYNRRLSTDLMRIIPGKSKYLLLIDRSLIPRGTGWKVRVRSGAWRSNGKRYYSADKTGYAPF